jgi:arylsulfatase
VRREIGYALYDLESDVGERKNVAEWYPDVVERLMAIAERAREDLGDGPRPGTGVRPCGVRRRAGGPGPGSP